MIQPWDLGGGERNGHVRRRVRACWFSSLRYAARLSSQGRDGLVSGVKGVAPGTNDQLDPLVLRELMPQRNAVQGGGGFFTHTNTEYCRLRIFSAFIRYCFVLISARVDVLVVEVVMEEPTISALLSMPRQAGRRETYDLLHDAFNGFLRFKYSRLTHR